MNGDNTLAFYDRQAQASQSICYALLRKGHTNDFFCTSDAQGHWLGCGHLHALVMNRSDGRVGCATNLQYQLGDALNVLYRQLGVNTALKTMARVGAEVEAARATCNGRRPPEGSFDIDVLRIVTHRRCIATHDASKRFDLMRVSDDAHFFIYRDGVAVQELELFSGFTPAHIQTTLNFVEVKDVRRTTQLEHHVI